MIDYTHYEFNVREWVYSLVLGCVIFFLIGMVFFNHLVIACGIASAGLLFPKMRTRQQLKKRKEELNEQFKQAIIILSSSLAAGKSVENAFRESLRDLQVLYPDEQTYIVKEFQVIQRKLDHGEPIEAILHDFSRRSGLEDIRNFSDVFSICKRSGGNLVEVMRNTANMISEKFSIQQEISVMMAQKKFESKVMSIAPVVFIALMRFSSPDYMAPLYQGYGMLIMGMALILLCVCFLISQKIMDIKV